MKLIETVVEWLRYKSTKFTVEYTHFNKIKFDV